MYLLFVHKFHDYIIKTGNERASRMDRFCAHSANIPVLPVKRVVSVRSAMQCGAHCLNNQGCIMFAFRRLGRQAECGLIDTADHANVTLGSQDALWGNKDVVWFAVGT